MRRARSPHRASRRGRGAAGRVKECPGEQRLGFLKILVCNGEKPVKNDIDALMQMNNIDALLVVGPGDHNPGMVYLTGGGHLTGADLIKKRGEPAVLFHASMERDEAAKTGLATRSYANYPIMEYLKETRGNRVEAAAIRYC